jgi:hypothetical protein
MDTTSRTIAWSPGRFLATFLCVASVGVAAGGAGGYLIRGTAASAQNTLAPTVVHPGTTGLLPLNADSKSGYETSSTGAPAAASGLLPLNADSTSGY